MVPRDSIKWDTRVLTRYVTSKPCHIEDAIITPQAGSATCSCESQIDIRSCAHLNRFCIRVSSTPHHFVGGGINERNIERILEQTSAKEFHCSARRSEKSPMEFQNTNGNFCSSRHTFSWSVFSPYIYRLQCWWVRQCARRSTAIEWQTRRNCRGSWWQLPSAGSPSRNPTPPPYQRHTYLFDSHPRRPVRNYSTGLPLTPAPTPTTITVMH